MSMSGCGEVHHRAHAGCELLSRTRGTSLNCLLGTSSKDKCLPPSGPLQIISAREFGAHDGSSPSATSYTRPPSGGVIKILNVPVNDVNAIHFPFGDQSGSDGVGAPGVGITSALPPFTEILKRLARPPPSRDGSQIIRPA